MIRKASVWSSVLLILAAGRAYAYVDPPTTHTLSHILSAAFIVASAAYIFLKHQCARFFRGLLRFLKRFLPGDR